MPASSNSPYVIAVLVMSALGIVSVVGITMLRPDADNTALIASCLGFLLPTTMALLAFMKSQETHLMVNSRLDEVIKATESSARAQGVVEGQEKAERRADTLAAHAPIVPVIINAPVKVQNGDTAESKPKP